MRTLVFVSTLAIAATCGMGTLWAFCLGVEWLCNNLPEFILQWLDLNIHFGMIGLAVVACGCFGFVAAKGDN